MKRYAMVIGLRAEKINEYKQLRAAVWPDVLKMIKQCHIQNYSIYPCRIDALNAAELRDQVKVIVCAAPLNQSFADEIMADGLSESARGAAALARRMVRA
jgi:L-rhamnose mutarotase